MSQISVICPVYNSAQFIGATVKSVQNQTVSDWQLILVDDCSTDNSLAVIKKLAAEDSRITFLTTGKNSGPAHARNIGIGYVIDHGTEYLAFIDSDDLYEPNFLEVMLDALEDTKADIAWCNYIEESPSTNIDRVHGFLDRQLLKEKEAAKAFIENRTGIGSLPLKMYRAAFIKGCNILLNPDRVQGEDWEFNYNLILKGAAICSVQHMLYHYVRQNNESVMSSYHHGDYENLIRTGIMLEKMADVFSIPFDKRDYNSLQLYNIVVLLISLNSSKTIKAKSTEQKRILESDSFKAIIKDRNFTLRYLTPKYKFYYILIRCKLYKLLTTLMTKFK